jgi:hypothetical protein
MGSMSLVSAVLLAIAVGGWLMVRRVNASRTEWKPIPGYFPGASYDAKAAVSGEHVALVCRLAQLSLVMHGPWAASRVVDVCRSIKVLVLDTDSWRNVDNELVAGEQMGQVLVVGKSMAGLCHELAHRCEEVIDGRQDYEHAAWGVRGINRAIDAFTLRLARERSEANG